MGEKKKEEKMGMSTIKQQSNHQRKERKTSQNQSLRLKSLPLRRKKFEVLKTTPASKLAVKAATVPETPVRNSKPSTKKTVTSKKDKKMVVRKLQPKEHQRCQNQRKWLKFHPRWKRKNLAVVLWREMVLGHLVQKNPSGEPNLLWVDKYQPRAVKQIIGQQGDKSKMRKLMNWLRDWEKNRKKPASKSSFFNKD
ncbi:replication factor C subunit 1-like isoform X2 [Pocillopora verrucosa]